MKIHLLYSYNVPCVVKHSNIFWYTLVHISNEFISYFSQQVNYTSTIIFSELNSICSQQTVYCSEQKVYWTATTYRELQIRLNIANYGVKHLIHLYQVSCIAIEETHKVAPPNQEQTPQLEKEQEKLSTPNDKTSEGKISSSTTTAQKTRAKQEAKKNRNIYSSPISSEDEHMQALTTDEHEKQIGHTVEESQDT